MQNREHFKTFRALAMLVGMALLSGCAQAIEKTGEGEGWAENAYQPPTNVVHLGPTAGIF